MKTVQDYKQLGLVFVQGDCINTFEEKKENPLNRSGVKYCNNSIHNDEKFAIEFAWRNNNGVKPEYKGVIEAELNNGNKPKAFVSELTWLRGFGSSVAKWRPVVLQSNNAQGNNDESFPLPIGIDSPELREAFKSLEEHLKNKPPFLNKSMPVFNCPCVAVKVEAIKPTVSPKEDKPMKPVYTAEMHAKGELPPVGAECILIVNDEPRPAKVTYIGKDIVCCSNIDGDAEYACLLELVSFKPIAKTIKVNGFDVPAPMSEAPMIGDWYYKPQTGYEVFYCANKWRSDGYDHRFLSRGLIHSTKSAAIAHAKAMLGIDPNA